MGYRIKEVREEKRMTQEELSAKSGIILYAVMAQLTTADHSEVSSLLSYIIYRLYMAVIAHH